MAGEAEVAASSTESSLFGTSYQREFFLASSARDSSIT